MATSVIDNFNNSNKRTTVLPVMKDLRHTSASKRKLSRKRSKKLISVPKLKASLEGGWSHNIQR